MARRPLIAVAWAQFQPRTVALAAALGGEARFIDDVGIAAAPAMRPLAYLAKSLRTWKLLTRDDPETVLVITPPVFAPLVAWLWCTTHRRTLLVDCHTGAFHSSRWAWARPLHKIVLKQARATLLHTQELRDLAAAWGARALLVPDDLPEPAEAAPVSTRGDRSRVLVAGSFDSNEPVEVALAAASLLPDIEFRFTGKPELVPERLRLAAGDNVVFTGYLAYPVFLGELLAADVVAVFSTDPRIMNRAAFEAVGLGRPLVLSDLPAVKSRFGSAALFCPNNPVAMARTIVQAIGSKDELTTLSIALQTRLRSQRDAAVADLQSVIDERMEPVWRRRSAS